MDQYTPLKDSKEIFYFTGIASDKKKFNDVLKTTFSSPSVYRAVNNVYKAMNGGSLFSNGCIDLGAYLDFLTEELKWHMLISHLSDLHPVLMLRELKGKPLSIMYADMPYFDTKYITTVSLSVPRLQEEVELEEVLRNAVRNLKEKENLVAAEWMENEEQPKRGIWPFYGISLFSSILYQIWYEFHDAETGKIKIFAGTQVGDWKFFEQETKEAFVKLLVMASGTPEYIEFTEDESNADVIINAGIDGEEPQDEYGKSILIPILRHFSIPTKALKERMLRKDGPIGVFAVGGLEHNTAMLYFYIKERWLGNEDIRIYNNFFDLQKALATRMISKKGERFRIAGNLVEIPIALAHSGFIPRHRSFFGIIYNYFNADGKEIKIVHVIGLSAFLSKLGAQLYLLDEFRRSFKGKYLLSGLGQNYTWRVFKVGNEEEEYNKTVSWWDREDLFNDYERSQEALKVVDRSVMEVH